MRIAILTIIFFSLFSRNSFGQSPVEDKIFIDSSVRTFLSSGLYVIGDQVVYRRGICKNNYWVSTISKEKHNANKYNIRNVSKIEKKKMTLVGSLTYEYLYRSYLDTPFVQNDFSQHTVHSNMLLTTSSGIPLNLNFRIRLSNSPYFKDNFDFTSSYTKDRLFQSIKSSLKKNLSSILINEEIIQLERRHLEKVNNVRMAQYKLKSPAITQKLIEEKERNSKAIARRNAGIDVNVSLLHNNHINDSTITSASNNPSEAKNILDSANLEYSNAMAELKMIEKDLVQAKRKLADGRREFLSDVDKIKDAHSVSKVIKKYGVSDTLLPKRYKLLSSVEKIGIGRNWVDYSELTVKNMLISGVNIETNFFPVVFSVSAGTINYGFRDFVLNQAGMPKQRLFAIRGGLGKSNGNKVVLTYYTGNKALLNSYNNSVQQTESVSGISLEGQFKIRNLTTVSIEVAKSTLPTYLNNGDANSKMLDFGLRSNEACAIKFNSELLKNTKIQGFYRRAGDRFQSFNMMPVSVQQEAWSFKLNRSFLKKKINIEAGLRKNDFENNLTNVGLYNSTIFKTFQLNIRVPKYPSVTLGFYPGSQLTILDNQTIAESFYNTFNAVVSHSYKLKKVVFNSNVVFVKFNSNSADTGFIYGNSESFSINQHFFVDRLSGQLSFGKIQQSGFSFRTLESSFSYKLKNWITILAGLKQVTTSSMESLYGENIGVQVRVFNIGNISVNYEQNYLPARNQKLLPVDFGRIIYTKTFK